MVAPLRAFLHAFEPELSEGVYGVWVWDAVGKTGIPLLGGWLRRGSWRPDNRTVRLARLT